MSARILGATRSSRPSAASPLSVVPILVTLLLARFAFSFDWPWPDWDLPRIPFPDLPDLSLPGWVREVLDKAKYVVAYVLARAEIARRRTQDQLRAREQQDDA